MIRKKGHSIIQLDFDDEKKLLPHHVEIYTHVPHKEAEEKYYLEEIAEQQRQSDEDLDAQIEAYLRKPA